MEFELNGEDLDLHFDLQENNNWRFLLDLENVYFRVVGFVEHNGEFVALIDTVDQSMFQEYFQGYTANIDIKHYFFILAFLLISGIMRRSFVKSLEYGQKMNYHETVCNRWYSQRLI